MLEYFQPVMLLHLEGDQLKDQEEQGEEDKIYWGFRNRGGIANGLSNIKEAQNELHWRSGYTYDERGS